MHRQSALRQTRCDGLHDVFRLTLAAAMNHRIVGITGERALRIGALHPEVERIMHEQVHQDWTDDPTLRITPFPWNGDTLRSLERSSEPSFDIQQDPVFLDVLANGFHQERVIDLIKTSINTLPILTTIQKRLPSRGRTTRFTGNRWRSWGASIGISASIFS